MKLAELLGKAFIAFAGTYGLLFVIAFLADLYMSEVRGDNFAAREAPPPLPLLRGGHADGEQQGEPFSVRAHPGA
jgi:hypothetical protein